MAVVPISLKVNSFCVNDNENKIIINKDGITLTNCKLFIHNYFPCKIDGCMYDIKDGVVCCIDGDDLITNNYVYESFKNWEVKMINIEKVFDNCKCYVCDNINNVRLINTGEVKALDINIICKDYSSFDINGFNVVFTIREFIRYNEILNDCTIDNKSCEDDVVFYGKCKVINSMKKKEKKIINLKCECDGSINEMITSNVISNCNLYCVIESGCIKMMRKYDSDDYFTITCNIDNNDNIIIDNNKLVLVDYGVIVDLRDNIKSIEVGAKKNNMIYIDKCYSWTFNNKKVIIGEKEYDADVDNIICIKWCYDELIIIGIKGDDVVMINNGNSIVLEKYVEQHINVFVSYLDSCICIKGTSEHYFSAYTRQQIFMKL